MKDDSDGMHDNGDMAGRDGMSVWCFSGQDYWALTTDEDGQVLPADLGPWVRRKKILMIGSNPDEVQALALIREHGFCCFDPGPLDAGPEDR